jgi:hypothetical protein
LQSLDTSLQFQQKDYEISHLIIIEIVHIQKKIIKKISPIKVFNFFLRMWNLDKLFLISTLWYDIANNYDFLRLKIVVPLKKNLGFFFF